MNYPSEEQLIRMKLSSFGNVKRLDVKYYVIDGFFRNDVKVFQDHVSVF